MNSIAIAPSILSANFAQLKTDVERLVKAGVEYIHYDVMDGHFVPNITFGAPLVASITPHFHVIHDVHLMITQPFDYFQAFIDAGATLITFHYETATSNHDILHWISFLHQRGIKAGISIKPQTDVKVLFPLIGLVDVMLIMSVEPGFGGQTFMMSAIEKIKALREKIVTQAAKTLIQVDGGINDKTGKLCRDAGVDILVSGSYLFSHHDVHLGLKTLRHG